MEAHGMKYKCIYLFIYRYICSFAIKLVMWGKKQIFKDILIHITFMLLIEL